MQTPLDEVGKPKALCRSLAEWTIYAEARPPFDLWGFAPAQTHAHEWTRARFDGSRLTLSHGCDGQTIAALELRQDSGGEWRALLSPCALSFMGCPEPESMAWVDLGEAFASCPPSLQRSLGSRALDLLLSR